MQINDNIQQMLGNQVAEAFDDEKVLGYQAQKLESLLQTIIMEKTRAERLA